MAIIDTALDLSDLLGDEELPADRTGVLAELAGVFKPSACEALVLCQPEGRPVAAACLTEGWDRQQLETACRMLTHQASVSPCQPVMLPTSRGQRVGLALPVDLPAEDGYLAVVLDGRPGWQAHLEAVRPALAACARAAWVAVQASTAAARAETRLRHLQSAPRCAAATARPPTG